ncbi:N-acetylglucosamine-6-phosphate deacetylase [Glaciecola petra]|uniref:N-acetylgalactosamine-6-phosphate deacetylase n=1 Tax=Glaciecola petra TaxID=3075602 RepID=A0ABU2ZT29_9ALTE|nr:N-acetylglucosamine-6-phosphate deacetylase [Aestuariibacter sp. P117]MDT0595799.1 N-acetylglucosamine-6-phosphate deacetylase [Aestuariibacter sp. P117]
MQTYYSDHFFDGNNITQSVLMSVDNGIIVDIQAGKAEDADVKLNGLVTSGFIDIQVNGGGGIMFNDIQTPKALHTIMAAHAQFGTTAMLPTLITDNHKKMHAAAEAIYQAIQHNAEGIVGIHFEGPHLSIIKKGIHSEKHIRPVSDADLATITRKDIGKVLVTLAPENVPLDVIKELVNQGVTVSLGHSSADIDTVLAAIEAGAKCFTHLFNAMSGLKAREPGMIAAALGNTNVYAGLIADGHHVHPYNCQLAYKCLGDKRLILVTDAMAHVGSDITSISWVDNVISKQNNRLSLADGSIAGSCISMANSVQNMTKFLGHNSLNSLNNQDNTALTNILNMASLHPAELMNLKNRGSLSIGKRADFVLLNAELAHQGTWIAGEEQ